MKHFFLILIFNLLLSTLQAQQVNRQNLDLERLVDEIFSVQDEDINYEELYENLAQLYSNQADLNLISEEQLRSIFILNEHQIQSFLSYRAEAGPFLSIYELQNIDGFSQDVIQKLIPFVTVIDQTKILDRNIFKRITSEKNNYLILRYDRTLEQKEGYLEEAPSSSKYLGSPDRFYARFLTRRPGDFSLGFTVEKDPGEQMSWSPSKKQYGPDYISFHTQVLNKGRLKNLIIGDYQAQFGQGLILGSAFGIGKNSEAITTIRRGNLGFMPYTSLYEASFMRGAAITYSINKQLSISGMLSSHWRDGSLKQDTLDGTPDFISTLQLTGLHRTESELENRKSVKEDNVAAVFNYKLKSLDAGFIYHYTHFNTQVISNPTIYNQFYFQGKENSNVGIFLNYHWKNFAFFSEAAHTINYGSAIVAGLIGSITSALDISLLYRKYDKDYHTFYSNAISENTLPINEKGIYWGWKYTFNKKYSFSGYVDFFEFPWLRYRSYSPSDGREWLFRINYRPSKNISLFVQAREEIKARNSSTNTNLYLNIPGTKHNYWINADYAVNTRLSFKTRAQFSTYSLDAKSNGMAIIQDINLNLGKIAISGRYALFDTDNYDNRLYIYEKDVWLAFSFPAYYGVGIRNYLLLQYTVSKNIDIWFRWAHVRYTDRNTIGSGGETIQGNIRNDIKFQTRIRL
jgi:hypothetical protein